MVDLPRGKKSISETGIHNLVNGCIAVERTAASIYNAFTQLFPEEKNFWEDLFKDEMEHSSFLIDAGSFGIFEELTATVLPLSVQLVEKTLRFATDMNREIHMKPVSLENALRMALKLEDTMVEIFTNHAITNLLFSEDKTFPEKILLGERVHIDKIKDLMIKRGFLKLS